MSAEVITKPVEGPSDVEFAHKPTGGHRVQRGEQHCKSAEQEPAATTLERAHGAKFKQQSHCLLGQLPETAPGEM